MVSAIEYVHLLRGGSDMVEGQLVLHVERYISDNVAG